MNLRCRAADMVNIHIVFGKQLIDVFTPLWTAYNYSSLPGLIISINTIIKYFIEIYLLMTAQILYPNTQNEYEIENLA